jgi:uncharacterized iron-regulated protein
MDGSMSPGGKLLPAVALIAACAARPANDRVAPARGPEPVAAPQADAGDESTDWAAAAQREHPLVGSVWDVASGERIDAAALVAALAAFPVALLGEKHDNPDHHRLEARVLGGMVAAGRWPAVVLEMLAGDLDADVDRVRAAAEPSPSDLRRALDWDARGSLAWDLYEPVFATTLAARLPIAAGGLDPEVRAALKGDGGTALLPADLAHLGLDRELPSEKRAAMAADIREAHCGRAPDALVARMVTLQRAVDGSLARAVLAAAARPDADGALLIAGIEHVRRDRAVPALLRRWVPETPVASVAFLEVIGGAESVAADLARRRLSRYPFDFVWFTPRVDDLDPCENFQSELERLPPASPPAAAPSDRTRAPRPESP